MLKTCKYCYFDPLAPTFVDVIEKQEHSLYIISVRIIAGTQHNIQLLQVSSPVYILCCLLLINNYIIITLYIIYSVYTILVMTDLKDETPKNYYVYLLECNDGCTYVGATIDLDHRLRQHNCEIKGGAAATSRRVKKGYTWKRVCHVSGFPTWSAALQFEWAWKFQSRKLSSKMKPVERRKVALDNLLALERPTSKAIPYSEWPQPIIVLWEG